MGGWGLKIPNAVRILKSVGNFGRHLSNLLTYMGISDDVKENNVSIVRSMAKAQNVNHQPDPMSLHRCFY